MVTKQATVVEILDAVSFRLRTDAIVILDGVTPPNKGSEAEKRAKERLAELVLKRKVSYETTQFDEFGRTRAKVQIDGVDVNESMADYIKSL
ncbi:MAG: thermonuclease family protein [Candidatus Bathyarchaeia archaeon]